MDEKTVKTLSGSIRRDVFGSWSDCDPGLYIGNEMIESVFREYMGRRIKITIEEVDSYEEG